MLLLPVFAARAVPIVDVDVCIYGGTSGGVVAAVEAARMGKTVALISTNKHLGGMTSGGLSATDIGSRETIGGLAREFYRRVGARDGLLERFNFEPHVAEEIFGEMLAEAGVVPHLKESLASVVKTAGRLVQIKTSTGTIYRAHEFIDATYEGDLMAKSGVTFTVGREGPGVYGESLAGVQFASPHAQFSVSINPYLDPHLPIRGILPWVHPARAPEPGGGDARVQCYTYRLCLTNRADHRLPITAPPGYSEVQFRLLDRFLETSAAAGRTIQLRDLLYFQALPGQKFDVNSNGPVSTDCIGLSDTWPTGTPAWRTVIALLHRRYTQGLLYYLGHSLRVSESLRAQMLQYGFCADEFTDGGGWPHQLYVREARRMVSDYVMLQQDCTGLRSAPDPIALGSYPLDCHFCARLIEQGTVKNEGGIEFTNLQPYGISYRSIVPRAGQCENLFVPFALSASHVGFSSIRMEPVFMMTSQSAATAACIAIDDAVAVQDVSYAKLAAQLVADGQLVAWPVIPVGGVVVDNGQDGSDATGAWQTSQVTRSFFGADYVHDGNAGKGGKTFRFTPTLAADGDYDVYLRWTSASNRATNVPVDVISPAGTSTVMVDQTQNGSSWVRLGRWNFSAGSSGSALIRTEGTNGYVVADAACWVPAGTSVSFR